jgi:hypothetical protein
MVSGNIPVRMTARLGEVRAPFMQGIIHIVTQTEEGVLAGIERSRMFKEAMSDLEDALGEDLAKETRERLMGGGQPQDGTEQAFADAFKECQKLDKAERGQKAKSGKLIYSQKGKNKIKIVLKYPKPVVLYEGALL